MSTVSEKLLQVAQNNPKVYHSGQLDIVKNAECLKGSKSGSAILLDDISPVEHNMGVKVRSKNLIPYPYYDNFTELDGVTYTINSDGSVTASGVITKGTNFIFCMGITLKAGTYTLSGVSNFSGMILKVYDNTEKIQLARVVLPQTSVTFTITQDYNNVQVYLNQAAIGTEVSGTVYPQLELGTTATDYTPYVPDLTMVKVKRCGKNLFDKSILFEDYTSFGNGYKWLSIYVGSGSTVTVSLLQKYDLGLGGYFYCVAYKSNSIPLDSNQKWLYHNSNTSLCKKSVTMISEDGYISLIMSAPAYNIFKDEIMVEICSNATEYEPYITPTEYTPTTDGVINGVKNLYPNTTLISNGDRVYIDCNYYKDIDKAYNKLSAEIALSGGE